MAQRSKLDLAQILSHPLVRKCEAELEEQQERPPATPPKPDPNNNTSINTKPVGKLEFRRNTLNAGFGATPTGSQSPGSAQSPFAGSLARRRPLKRSLSRSPETPVYEGLYNNTMASPRPKLKLANFSISPYVESK